MCWNVFFAAVLGLDNFNDYYPVSLKRSRQAMLDAEGVHVVEGDINDKNLLKGIFGVCNFTYIVHLAAQVGSFQMQISQHFSLFQHCQSFETIAPLVNSFPTSLCEELQCLIQSYWKGPIVLSLLFCTGWCEICDSEPRLVCTVKSGRPRYSVWGHQGKHKLSLFAIILGLWNRNADYCWLPIGVSVLHQGNDKWVLCNLVLPNAVFL